MPNRVLRDTTDSDKVNSLSVHAERFFYRLIMKVDDYGCFFADPRILKAHLFPLQLDQIREVDVSKWVSDCTEAGLIVVYGSGTKKYLEILDFKQSLRQKNRKFPAQADCKQNDFNVQADCEHDASGLKTQSAPETKRNESRNQKPETKPETRNEGARPALVLPFESLRFREVWGILLATDKWKKKKPEALQMALKILGDNSEIDAIEMMEKAIAGEWQGLHPLNKTKHGGKPTFKNAIKGDFPDQEFGDAIHKHFGSGHSHSAA